MNFLKQKWLVFFLIFPLLLSASPEEETPRDYWAELSQEQHSNLSFLLSTLSREFVHKVFMNKSKLRQAGKTLSPIHPLRYLEHIFTHPDLLKDLCGISQRRIEKIWLGFLNGEDGGEKDGMIGSLRQEDALGNLKPEHIENFTRNCNLDYVQISKAIRSKQWNQMIGYIMTEATKRNNQELYDL